MPLSPAVADVCVCAALGASVQCVPAVAGSRPFASALHTPARPPQMHRLPRLLAAPMRLPGVPLPLRAAPLSAASGHFHSAAAALDRVLLADGVDEVATTLLEGAGHVVVNRPKLSADELMDIIGDFDAVVVRSASKITVRCRGWCGRSRRRSRRRRRRRGHCVLCVCVGERNGCDTGHVFIVLSCFNPPPPCTYN